MSAEAERRRATGGSGTDTRGRAALVWLGLLGIGLVCVFVWPTVAHGLRLGVGPDVSVYLWWARAASANGLSVVGERPGTPALVPVLVGASRIPWVPVVAGTQYATAVAVGLAAAGVARRRIAWEGAWILAGALTGLFAVHLASGYLANLVFALTFLAAIAALGARSRRGTVAAAILLAGGGLAHPLFFMLGISILAGAAVWSWAANDEDGPGHLDALRIATAVAGAGAIVAGGLLWVDVGPARIAADTSKDAFLRRVGLGDTLQAGYLDRFRRSIWRFVPWLLLPLAAVGTPRVAGLTRRLLAAWAIVTVVGVPVGALTGWYPPSRVLTFGFALPILAAAGIAWIVAAVASRDRFPAGRMLAWGAGIACTVVLVGSCVLTWREAIVYASPEQLASASAAGQLAEAVPPGTPLVFVVDAHGATSAFGATNAANVIRAAVPGDRAGDVVVFPGSLADLRAGRTPTSDDPLTVRLSRDVLERIPAGPRVVFVLRPFVTRAPGAEDLLASRPDHLVRYPHDVWATGLPPETAATGRVEATQAIDRVEASSPTTIVAATVAVLALLWAIGFAWARWTVGDVVVSAAIAPAFGAAVTILVAIVADRLGFRVGVATPWPAALIVAIAASPGVALLLLQGPADTQPVPQIEHRDREEDGDRRGDQPLVHP